MFVLGPWRHWVCDQVPTSGRLLPWLHKDASCWQWKPDLCMDYNMLENFLIHLGTELVAYKLTAQSMDQSANGRVCAYFERCVRSEYLNISTPPPPHPPPPPPPKKKKKNPHTLRIRFLYNAEILNHWGRVTHIFVSKLTIIGSDNGLSPGRRQAIIWTNAGILLIGPFGTHCSEILIKIHTFSFT